ncbi:hypothetical protein DFH28DRAFT_1081431 [Melampsora americana]|nr:hypothetical protein DFH28DRAFT_1081431 [Melampsora americana]
MQSSNEVKKLNTSQDEDKEEVESLLKSIPILQTLNPTKPISKSNFYLSILIFIIFLNFIFNFKSNLDSNQNVDHQKLNQFEALNHFFIQTDLKTNPNQFKVYGFNSSFGLQDKSSPDAWSKFDEKIKKLNSQKPKHGEGFHNIAESKYGTPIWDCYWSELNGDQNITWGPDSRLTKKGQNQIELAKESWKLEISKSIPIPSLFITSPLSRAIETMKITGIWNLTKNYLKLEKETDQQIDIRIKKSLEKLFNDSNDIKHTYISITAHSGVINSLLRVIGHRPFPTETGGMIPLVIKGSINPTPTRPPSPGPSATKPDCPTDYLSSKRD